MALASNYFVFKGSEMLRLKKGMDMNEVRNLLGNDFAVESCVDKNDQKWVYDFPESKGTYKLFFRQDRLEWAINGTNFIKKTMDEKLDNTTKKKKPKSLDTI